MPTPAEQAEALALMARAKRDRRKAELQAEMDAGDAQHRERLASGYYRGALSTPGQNTASRDLQVSPPGRPLRENADGSVSSELSITVPDPRSPGAWINIPSIYGGQEVPEEDAVARIGAAGYRDPETGREIQSYGTLTDAVSAAQARSDSLPTGTAPEVETGTQAPAAASVGTDTAVGRAYDWLMEQIRGEEEDDDDPGIPMNTEVRSYDTPFQKTMDFVRQVNAGGIPGSEEMTAAIGATPNWLFAGDDDKRSWNEHYTSVLNNERDRHNRFVEKNPWLSLGAQTAGALATAIPTIGYGMGSAIGQPGLVRRGMENVSNLITGHRPGMFQPSGIHRQPFSQRVAGGAAAGGGLGLAFGFGHGEGGARNRTASGIGDMYTGGTIGAATPFVGAAARPVLGYLAKRRAARRGGISTRAVDPVQRALQQGTDDVAGNVEPPEPGTLVVDQFGSARELLGDRLARMGDDADEMRRFIKGRADSASERVTRALDESFGGAPTEGAEAVGKRLRQETKAARKAAYDDAYAAPIDYASESGRALEQWLWRVDPRFFRVAERKMREKGVASKQFFITWGPDGRPQRHRMPDVREIDYITRALNDGAKIERGKVKPGASTTDQGQIWEEQVQNIRDLLKENVNQYATALRVAAPPIVARTAMNLGMKALSPSVTRGKLQSDIAELKASHPHLADMVDEHVAKGMRYQFQEVVDRAKDPLARNPSLSGAVAVGSTREPVTARTIKDLSSKVVFDKITLVIGRKKADELRRVIDENAAATTTREAVEENVRKRRQKAEEEEGEAGVLENLFNLRPGSAAAKAVQRRRERRENNKRQAVAVANALLKKANEREMTAIRNVRKPSERGLVGAKRAEMGVGGTALAGVPAGEDWNPDTGGPAALAKILARRAMGPAGAFMP